METYRIIQASIGTSARQIPVFDALFA